MYGVNDNRARDIWELLDPSFLVSVKSITLRVGDVLVDDFGGVVAHIDEVCGPLDIDHNSISGRRILRRDLVRPGVAERALSEFEDEE